MPSLTSVVEVHSVELETVLSLDACRTVLWKKVLLVTLEQCHSLCVTMKGMKHYCIQYLRG